MLGIFGRGFCLESDRSSFQEQYGEEDPFGAYDEQPGAYEVPEPPFTIALIAGGSGTEAQRDASLASARTLMEQLQTAPYDLQRESLLSMLRSSGEFPEGLGDHPDEASLPEDLQVGGINVVAYWLDCSMNPHRITAADLLASSSTDLDYKLHVSAEALLSIEVTPSLPHIGSTPRHNILKYNNI